MFQTNDIVRLRSGPSDPMTVVAVDKSFNAVLLRYPGSDPAIEYESWFAMGVLETAFDEPDTVEIAPLRLPFAVGDHVRSATLDISIDAIVVAVPEPGKVTCEFKDGRRVVLPAHVLRKATWRELPSQL
jgi:hypothetical protein